MTAARRVVVVVLSALLAAGGLAGCTGADPGTGASPTSTLAIEVAGEVGARPSLTIPEGLSITQTSTALLIEGDGPVLEPGQTVLLDYLAIDITSGETTADTYAGLPEVWTFTPEEMGAALYDLLDGARVGSRLERIELGTKTNPHPHVLVVDVLPLRAVGDELTSDPALPAVTRAEDGAPTVTIPEAGAPHQAITTTLIKGAGAQVAIGQSVILQLSTVRWADGAVVDSTWGALPRAVAVSDLPRGLAGGIVEQTVGSQVLVVVPPEDGNGVDTLVYVVDILATADVTLPPQGTEHQPSDEGATQETP